MANASPSGDGPDPQSAPHRAPPSDEATRIAAEIVALRKRALEVVGGMTRDPQIVAKILAGVQTFLGDVDITLHGKLSLYCIATVIQPNDNQEFVSPV